MFGTKKFEIVPHHPYSSNLVSCYFLLFLIVKKNVKGYKFESEELIRAVQAILKHIFKNMCSEKYI